MKRTLDEKLGVNPQISNFSKKRKNRKIFEMKK